MSSKGEIGIGILGAASIARKNVKAIGKNHKGLVIVAVGSRTLSKAEAFIKEMDLSAKAYGSYEEVLKDPRVHAVYLPLPTATHLEWVKKAAAAKKHVLLEKPIALTTEETEGIVGACSDAGVQFMDGTMFVHHPRTAAMHHIVRDPQAFGNPMTVTSTFTWKATEDFFANDVRTRKDGDALGCYGDIGWYCIRAALWAFNYEKPVTVQAHPGRECLFACCFRPGGPKMNKNGVVMHGGGTLLWADGRRLTFDCGFDTVHSMYLQIAGSDGMVEVKDFCIPYDPKKCSFTQKQGAVWHDNDTWIEQPMEEKQFTLDRPQETHMWERFADCIDEIRAGGKPDSSWPEQSALCNKLCIAVERSAQNKCQPIDVTDY